ncbi:enolase C-terminal domain-like protein [Streptomyces violarus]|uniref:enolase C-terminal domain-like protein n=1 Tax=Streptomyces violarus TaxID=67380 RepID=UPI0021BEF42E|nr:enolase C-terminal domain-like protein [Streptomyces violarus]MCT9145437.1 hypothetical protein [Streptomyces violarus]
MSAGDATGTGCKARLRYREVARDLRRARAARHVIGDEAELYVDANGALDPRAARSTLPGASATDWPCGHRRWPSTGSPGRG